MQIDRTNACYFLEWSTVVDPRVPVMPVAGKGEKFVHRRVPNRNGTDRGFSVIKNDQDAASAPGSGSHARGIEICLVRSSET